jgi:ATP-dependent helicase/nuclease subunit B
MFSNAKSLQVYKAKDMIDQLKTVARNISRDLYNGISPDDVIIAGENLEYDAIKRVLSDFDVPFYMSKKEALMAHPLATYLLGVLQCVRKGMKRADVTALAKNPSVFATKQERDAFCRYVNENLVEYKGFLSAFDRESVYRDRAEKVRERIAKIFIKTGALRSSASVFEFVKICKNVLDCAYIAPAPVSIDFDKAKTIITEALEFVGGVYGDCVLSVDFLVDSIRDLLTATEFSLVQKTTNVVKVGTLNDFRGQRYKKIYLLSFNDGVLPKIEEDVALLTDSDIAEMESFGLEFGGRISVLNERYKDELWQLLQNESDVFASYVCEENGKKSYDLKLLSEQFNIEKEKSSHSYISTLNTCIDSEKFASLVSTKANGKELVGAITDKKLKASLVKAIGGIVEDNYSFEKGIKELSLPLTSTSVSSLQSYYSCPFSYFCKSVLRIKKKEDGKVTPIDVGNIIHETLSEFLQLENKDPIDEKVTDIVNKRLLENPKSTIEANKAVVDRLKIEAVKICKIAHEQICKGKYTVKECEIPFGREESKLKTIAFDGVSGEVKLVGAIDRIDEWNGRARVIDYKTGSGGKFSYSDIYYGTKLQLPLYMAVAMENNYKPGGFFYFPIVESWSEEDSACKLSGAFEKSDDNVLAMEHGSISEGATVFDMPLSKRTGEANRKNGLTEDGIKEVCNYAIRMAQNAVNAIENGDYRALPIKTAKGTVCDFCDFAGVCKRDADLSARSRNLTDSITRKYVTKEN